MAAAERKFQFLCFEIRFFLSLFISLFYFLVCFFLERVGVG